jgi:hypothetical protein
MEPLLTKEEIVRLIEVYSPHFVKRRKGVVSVVVDTAAKSYFLPDSSVQVLKITYGDGTIGCPEIYLRKEDKTPWLWGTEGTYDVQQRAKITREIFKYILSNKISSDLTGKQLENLLYDRLKDKYPQWFTRNIIKKLIKAGGF